MVVVVAFCLVGDFFCKGDDFDCQCCFFPSFTSKEPGVSQCNSLNQNERMTRVFSYKHLLANYINSQELFCCVPGLSGY